MLWCAKSAPLYHSTCILLSITCASRFVLRTHFAISVILFFALLFFFAQPIWESEIVSGVCVGADAWCSGSEGTTRCIHGRNFPLTVSPLCPGWPGSPSFPAGPWGWKRRQFIKIKTSGRKWVLIFEKIICDVSAWTCCC